LLRTIIFIAVLKIGLTKHYKRTIERKEIQDGKENDTE